MEREDGSNAPARGVAPGPAPGHRPSLLFTVRLWPEELGDGQVEWRGRVEHVTTGQWRYFREWPALLVALQEMLAAGEEGPGSKDEPVGQVGVPGQGGGPSE